MKRNKKLFILWLIALVIVVILIVTLFLSEGILRRIQYGVAIVGSISSLITLFIALLLFNKFGIEKSILDKNMGVVIKLATEINKLVIYVETEENLLVAFRPSKLTKKRIRSFPSKNALLVFNLDYMESMGPIMDLTCDLFIPKTIKDKLMLVCPVSFTNVIKKSELKNYLLVSGDLQMFNKDKGTYGYLNDEKVIFREYIKCWEKIIKVMKKWIGDNSSISFELNF